MMRTSALFFTGAAALRVGVQPPDHEVTAQDIDKLLSDHLMGASCLTYAPGPKKLEDCYVPLAIKKLNMLEYGPNAPPGANCAGLNPGPGQTQCVVDALETLLKGDTLYGSNQTGVPGIREKVEELLAFLQMPMPGQGCSGVQDPKKCEQDQQIEKALEKLAAAAKEDIATCAENGPNANRVTCVKSKLKRTMIRYVLKHPSLIHDVKSLKREIKSEFPNAEQKVIEQILEKIAAEILKAYDGKDIDSEKILDLASHLAATVIGDDHDRA